MGRPRKHADDAARQAAKRARDKAEWVEVPRVAHEAHSARLEALQRAVGDAARRGDVAAQACRAGGVDTMLDKLTAWFEAQVPGREGAEDA